MGKYINKNDKYAISELLKTFIDVASGKNTKKSLFSAKKTLFLHFNT
jgi:altronate dehydratase